MIERATNGQIFSFIFLLVSGFVIVSFPKDVVPYVGTESYITIIFHTIILILGLLLSAYLGYTNKNMTVFEYSGKIAGKVCSYIISIYYILYFNYTLLVVMTLGINYIKQVYFPITPVWALSLVSIAVGAYIAGKNLSVILKLFQLMITFTIVMVIPITIMILFLGDVNNLKPLIGSQDLSSHIKAIINPSLVLNFTGAGYLQLIPFSNINSKKVYRYCISAAIALGLYYLLLTESSIAYMGVNQITRNSLPLISIIKRLPYSYIRLDAIFLTIAFALILCMLSFYIYSSNFFINRIFKKSNFIILVLVDSIIIYIIFQFFYKMNLPVKLLKTIYLISESASQLIIPIALLAVSFFKSIKPKQIDN